MDFNKAVILAESRYYNKTLHPSFWSNETFNSDIRSKLLNIVTDFFGEPENVVEIDDIQLTGSLANFNYTKHSDLDIHILLDFAKINKDKDLVKRALDGKRFVWNLRHNITIRDHEVELYYQDTNEPHIASGLYSLKDDIWLTKPTYNPPSIDEKDVLKKANGITDMVRRIKQKVNDDVTPCEAKKLHAFAKRIKDKLGVMRSDGLKREGEFSVENLAFKELRNNGAIGELIKVISTAYSKIYTERKEAIHEISSFNDLIGTSQPTKTNHKQLSHRGINRKRQTWVPDVHRITRDDIVDQKVEKSKEDNISRMLNKMEVLRACNKYGISVSSVMNGDVKELGTSKTKIWYDGNNFFIQGMK